MGGISGNGDAFAATGGNTGSGGSAGGAGGKATGGTSGNATGSTGGKATGGAAGNTTDGAGGGISSQTDGGINSGDSAMRDATSDIAADAPSSGVDATDASARDAAGSDRGYLPSQSPDGSIPDCMWALFRQCCAAPGESCVETLWDGGGVDDTQCWPTGERETYNDTTHTRQAYTSDGALCFTIAPSGEYATYGVYDGLGQEVATYLVLNDGSGQVQISCDGTTYLSTPPFSCSTILGMRGKCVTGPCPR